MVISLLRIEHHRLLLARENRYRPTRSRIQLYLLAKFKAKLVYALSHPSKLTQREPPGTIDP